MTVGPKVPKPRQWDPKIHDAIMAAHERGLTAPQIAKELRTNNFQVYYHLRSEGIEPNIRKKLLTNPPEKKVTVLTGRFWIYYCKATAGAGYPWVVRRVNEVWSRVGEPEILAKRIQITEITFFDKDIARVLLEKFQFVFNADPEWHANFEKYGHLASVKAYIDFTGTLRVDNL